MEHDKCERKGMGKTQLTLEVRWAATALPPSPCDAPCASLRAPLPREFQAPLPSKPPWRYGKSQGVLAGTNSCVWVADPTPTLQPSMW